jgi:hypothetical protein
LDARITSFSAVGLASFHLLSMEGVATLHRIVEATVDSNDFSGFPGCGAAGCLAESSLPDTFDENSEYTGPVLDTSLGGSVRGKVKSVAPFSQNETRNASKEKCNPGIFEICGEWTACPLGKLPTSLLSHSHELSSQASFDPMVNALKTSSKALAESPAETQDAHPLPVAEPTSIWEASKSGDCADNQLAAIKKVRAQEFQAQVDRFQQAFRLM